MAWYDRVEQGIQTETSEKKEAPDGLWIKCPSCSNIDTMEVLQGNFHVCPHCDYHFRINSKDYFEIIFNDNFEEIHGNIISKDFLSFEDKKQYKDRIVQAQNKTKLDDSIKSQEDIEGYLNLPFLGYIPNIKTNSIIERDLDILEIANGYANKVN